MKTDQHTFIYICDDIIRILFRISIADLNITIAPEMGLLQI
jgi:hypothetical protein